MKRLDMFIQEFSPYYKWSRLQNKEIVLVERVGGMVTPGTTLTREIRSLTMSQDEETLPP